MVLYKMGQKQETVSPGGIIRGDGDVGSKSESDQR